MELRNLITFIHVAELGSFTKAAEQLGYSQSTISFQIKQIEDELGCLLFERINHTITLTKRGHELVSYAHQIRTLTEEFKENLDEKECTGHIHLVTPDSLCDALITKNYIDFHKIYPDISIKFTTADTSVMFDMLDHNEADVIITLDSHSYHKDYVIAKEEPISMHFVASSNSKFSKVKNLSINDIINEPFILTEYGQGYRRVFDKELAKKSLEITPILEIGRTDMITSIVADSDALSFLPDFVTKELVESGKLCYLDVCDINIEIWKQLIYHKNKWISKALKTLIDYIIETNFSK
ncbi:MAG: LysR family transcriptional regulator [Ruminococcaceae bacterium]|nr:LysR family transcriptional regulator [Oscillospiraceae bacterium]